MVVRIKARGAGVLVGREVVPQRGTGTGGVPAPCDGPRVVAVVVARMGSTRLPGKHLEDLGGATLLARIVERVRRAASVHEVVLATGSALRNARLADEAARLGMRVVHHPDEDDVLGRLVRAADTTEADVVVSVLGDTPFVDPEMIDCAVRTLVASGAEEATSDPAHRPNVYSGVDVRTRTGLRRLDTASRTPREREHAGLYTKEHPGFLRTIFFSVPPELRRSDMRLTVDTPADLELTRRAYAAVAGEDGYADLRAVVRWLDRHPDVRTLNAHVRQRNPLATKRPILFSSDRKGALALERLPGLLVLADELRETHGVAVHFAVPNDPAILERLRERKLPYATLPDRPRAVESTLRSIADRVGAGIVVLDRAQPVPPNAVKALQNDGHAVVVVDQVLAGARLANATLLQPNRAAGLSQVARTRVRVLGEIPHALSDRVGAARAAEALVTVDAPAAPTPPRPVTTRLWLN